MTLVVDSPLSLDEARRALSAALPKQGPTVSYGQCALYGTVDGDSVSLRWDSPDPDSEVPGSGRVMLRARGDHVRAHAFLSGPAEPRGGMIAISAAIMTFSAITFFKESGTARWDSFAWAVVAALVALMMARRPAGPSRLFVGHVKEFLSHALLAEPIEVRAGGKSDA